MSVLQNSDSQNILKKMAYLKDKLIVNESGQKLFTIILNIGTLAETKLANRSRFYLMKN